MTSKILDYLKFLEDPRYPCLGPHLRLLNFVGMWHPDLQSRSTQAKLILFYIIVAFFFSQYVKCCISLYLGSLSLIRQYTPFHMGIVKSCFFQKDYKLWEQVIHYTSTIEGKLLATKQLKIHDVMKDYIARSRRVTYFFWALAFFSNFSIFSGPYQKNQINENGTRVYYNMFNGYTPFNQKIPPGYYVAMGIQTILGNVVTMYVVGWDTLVVSMMIFLAGQLKVTRYLCKQLAMDSDELTHGNISDCHLFYVSLIKYQKALNSLMSPIMFVYLIVISVNLCVIIIQIVEIKDDLAAVVSNCNYILACLVQLLLFYWYANEVTEESDFVKYGVFQCDWVRSDRRILKEIALLQLSMNKTFIFTAGPFNAMTLSTFIGILRLSYSFFTLMKETNDS